MGDLRALDATVAAPTAEHGDQETDGVLGRAAEEVAEQATRAVSFVGRLGSAFGDGLRDARTEQADQGS